MQFIRVSTPGLLNISSHTYREMSRARRSTATHAHTSCIIFARSETPRGVNVNHSVGSRLRADTSRDGGERWPCTAAIHGADKFFVRARGNCPRALCKQPARLSVIGISSQCVYWIMQIPGRARRRFMFMFGRIRLWMCAPMIVCMNNLNRESEIPGLYIR